ncbi:MAG: radical SAM family heme chaperone HemW [Desulfobacterota bacterium]|nr:radical SAM family heme chaperone HemW [Thermodesulfobacteriota bacterium]
MIPIQRAGLYIHIPFCLSKCPYCGFYSTTSVSQIPAFLEGLFREMEMAKGRDPLGPFDTLYLGGGTPSLLDPSQLERLLNEVRKEFDLSPESEITIEANPGDLNRSYLRSISELGINRIVIGVQSFEDEVLAFLGRRHSAAEAFQALEWVREAGFQNLGIDLIYGVPGQGLEAWLQDLKQALSFLPEHLSCYELTFEPETPLGRRFRSKELPAPKEEARYEFFLRTSEFLEGNGYLHYEVSNFAREANYASRHNQKYWDHSPYLGLGPSAHSFQSDRRWWNHRCLDRYLEAIAQGTLPMEGQEVLTLEQLKLETLFLSLRTRRGIDLADFKARFGSDLLTDLKGVLTRLEEEGLILLQEGHLSPTVKGLAVADGMALL